METSNKKTLVFGASPKEDRYSNKAVRLLRDYHHEVVAIGLKPSKIEDIEIQIGHPKFDDIHTLTLYLNNERQKDHQDYFLSLKPKRIIFNPGAENQDLFNLAKAEGIEVINACTLVMLRTSQF